MLPDEWYILAGEELPEEERYDGYLQLENGVGMLRLLETEVREAVKERAGDDRAARVTLATGKLAGPYLKRYLKIITEKFPNVETKVRMITNHFFGEEITVSGLITGTDLKEQLGGQELGTDF